MKNKKRNPLISTFSAQITSTVSVTLVLLVLGVVALLGIAAKTLTRDIKENIGLDIVMATSEAKDVEAVKQTLTKAPYVAGMDYISAEDALAQMQEDMDEDLMELFGANPFNPEFEVRVKEEYANSDSLAAIQSVLASMPQIQEVATHSTEMVDSINHNFNTVALVLVVIAGALLVVSFVLINNTVRLTIYSRRFTIHTMKLVGATGGFIRKPFLVTNAFHGLLAGVIASGILAGLLYYGHTLDASIRQTITWEWAGAVFAGIAVLGVIICTIAALFATNKYLRLDYDEMFK